MEKGRNQLALPMEELCERADVFGPTASFQPLTHSWALQQPKPGEKRAKSKSAYTYRRK
jgi:hypothetical protein